MYVRCCWLQFCFSFKDVLSVAVGKLSAVKDDADATKILHDLYEVVNAVDTSGVRNLSDMERRLLKRTVSSNGRSGAKDMEESLYFRTHAQWHGQKIPLQFKLCSTDDQYDDGLLRKLLLKFGEQTMLIYNAVLTGARVLVLGYNQAAGMCSSWICAVDCGCGTTDMVCGRLLGEVCNYVLSTSSLVCPPLFGLIQRQFP